MLPDHTGHSTHPYGKYNSDEHLVDRSVGTVHAFNGVETEVFSGVTPYERIFTFDPATLPADLTWSSKACVRAVVYTSDGGQVEGEPWCRAYTFGPFEPIP